MRVLVSSAVLLIPFLASVGGTSAQDEVGRAKVRFPFARSMGVAGDAMEGLGLRLTRRETGEIVEVATGPDGSFVFRDLAPGAYRLHLAPPEDAVLDDTISVALPRLVGGDARGRAKRVREIVVVGISESERGGARGIPAHTPEWTNLSDADPGVAGGDGHGDWIELVRLHATGDDETWLVTIPPAAWEAAVGGDSFFDITVDPRTPSEDRRPRRRIRGEPAGVTVRGGVVFGDGIHGRRPPSGEPVAPALRAEPVDDR